MSNVKQVTLEALQQLELNANIQYFAEQWSEENGLSNLDDLFALFDRLQLDYVLVPNVKHQDMNRYHWAFSVQSETNIQLLESRHVKADTAVMFYVLIENAPKEKASTDWVGERLHAFRPMLPKLLLVSFISNLFALCIPFITMSIYDHVIGGDAGHELQGIAIGALLLFVMMGLLRMLRSKAFTMISNRLSREISQAVVHKILNNSYAVNQQSSTTSQLSQTQLGERIAAVLSGPLGNALFDIPFVLIFIIAIAVLGGYLVIVPILALALYAFFVMRYLKVSSKRALQSTIAGSNRQNMLNELTSKLGFIRQSGMLTAWLIRFEKANHLAAKSSFSQTTIQSRYTSLYYLINIGATLAVMGLGIDLIFENVLTAGGLIAAMMLISKVTGPAQMLANSAMRLQSFKQSSAQLNRIMQQPAERDFTYQHHPLTDVAPSMTLDQVTLRYAKQPKPALSGVSFSVEPGQVVAIVGPSGCGKTTLMELMAGLVMPQNGLVQVNGVNLSQYDPQLYRHWCFMRAALPELMVLSIRDWLSDGRDISDAKMREAIRQVDGERWLNSLDHGLDTEIAAAQANGIQQWQISNSSQILVNAKSLVHDYPLYLLDNPVPDNHPTNKRIFNEFIEQKRGKASVVFSSHDPELIKLADTVVVLEAGSVVYAGPLQQADEQAPEQTHQDTLQAQPEVNHG
ncbi:ABC transporter ATP-binding protein [Psychromonas sp. psych-6C06]|uniref:peptidase domain-containing ABC transporter n=1 Tax=Psychromonas sp. psych-6C06 TaxID=2058089 RepID=UPI000C334147|nr:ATP-binding cassette domain-containing protein [Psychromonas sp. psych-6C06]PKF62454.1 ABC transporter ATP-binding protein [Psychromonas sp. psych-6C06]